MRCLRSSALFVVLLLQGGAFLWAAEPPANFVTNPGFEAGNSPWMARGSASLLVSTTAQTGVSAAFITNRSSTSSGVAQSLLGVLRPGWGYFCAAWARAESATSQV